MAQKIKSQKHTYNMTSLIYLYENEQNQIIFKGIFICSKIMKKSKGMIKFKKMLWRKERNVIGWEEFKDINISSLQLDDGYNSTNLFIAFKYQIYITSFPCY